MPEATRAGLARALSAPRPSDDLLPEEPARSPDERDQQYHVDKEDDQLRSVQDLGDKRVYAKRNSPERERHGRENVDKPPQDDCSERDEDKERDSAEYVTGESRDRGRVHSDCRRGAHARTLPSPSRCI